MSTLMLLEYLVLATAYSTGPEGFVNRLIKAPEIAEHKREANGEENIANLQTCTKLRSHRELFVLLASWHNQSIHSKIPAIHDFR